MWTRNKSCSHNNNSLQWRFDMATLPKNKKEFISSLKQKEVTTIKGKRLTKCTLAVLKEEYFVHFPDMKPKEEPVKKAPKKKAVAKAETKEQVEQPVKSEKEQVADCANMDMAALLQLATEVSKDAKKAGKENKEQITKPSKVRKSKWSDVIPLLLASQANQNKDGSFTFSLQEVIDLTGMPVTNEKTGKPSSWTIYSGDWKPTYKGIGSSVVLLGHCAQVKGAPSSKEARQQFDATQASNWTLTLSPITPEQQIALMEPRLKGKIKNWVYTVQQFNTVKAQLDSQE